MNRILLIEPDIMLAKIYRQALEHAGYRVDAAGTAQDGISLADKARPDLTILELQLAAHNGIEFLYEFRSYPEWQAVPVIIHTLVPPTAVEGAEALWQQLAIATYLYKPQATLDQLIRAVRKCLAESTATKT